MPLDALLQQVRDEEGRVDALVPRPTPGNDKLSGGEKQGGAVGRVQADGDGSEFALVVEREREHLVDLMEVKRTERGFDLRGGHYVVHHR